MLMRLDDRMVTLMIMLTMLMIKTKKKKMMMTTLMVGLVLVAVMMMMMMMTMIVTPRMFWEERLGKIEFRASPKRVGPRILSLESVDYFGASEHY